jgi:predicted nucleic acid-binding protein
MNQLEKWHKDGVITLKFPEHAQSEAESGYDLRRARKARDYFIPHAFITTDDERRLLREIEEIIFGYAALSKQDRNDALIVFTAKKYFAILVTADRKVLRAAKELRQLNVQVMADEEAVQQIREMISARDRMARSYAERKGKSVPDWVGKV